jgi:hypothetical protein
MVSVELGFLNQSDDMLVISDWKAEMKKDEQWVPVTLRRGERTSPYYYRWDDIRDPLAFGRSCHFHCHFADALMQRC